MLFSKMAFSKTQYFYNKLNQYFENNIKLSYISYVYIFIVTKDDKVYALKKNAIHNSLLVLTHNKSIIEQKINESIVKELCNKMVIDFDSSGCHRMALTFDGKLYCWGRNVYGVFGNGKQDKWDENKLYKPELNEYMIDKHICAMSCGDRHSLVLTNDGEVYGWGYNIFGQIGNGKSGPDEHQLIPCLVREFNGQKIKSIACGFWHSLGLTESGRVYSWGSNEWAQLGRNTDEEYHSNCPKLIELKDDIIIEKISCGCFHSLLISREGEIYVFGSYGYEEFGQRLYPMKLKSSQLFTDIASRFDFFFSSALSTNGLYYIWGKVSEEEDISEPKQTLFTSFNEIFVHYFGISYNLIKDKLISFNDDFFREEFYSKCFEEVRELGKGSYGHVFEVISNTSEKIEEKYAIKKINLKTHEKISGDFTEEILRELENFSFIRELYNTNEKVLKYYDLWLENTPQVNAQTLNLTVFIEMELCDKSLNDLMNDMKNDTILVDNNRLTLIGYYISSELFVQILEGVKYLHTRNPQLIHRDLNPFNILIKINERNKSVIKIADMGLVCLHKYKNLSHTEGRGNTIFMAPELLKCSKFDTRADIYSLGVVLQDLFLIDINEEYTERKEKSLLFNKYQKLSELCIEMINAVIRKRPQSCQQILEDKELWALNERLIKFNNAFIDFSDKCSEEYKNSFIYKLIMKL